MIKFKSHVTTTRIHITHHCVEYFISLLIASRVYIVCSSQSNINTAWEAPSWIFFFYKKGPISCRVKISRFCLTIFFFWFLINDSFWRGRDEFFFVPIFFHICTRTVYNVSRSYHVFQNYIFEVTMRREWFFFCSLRFNCKTE